MSMKKDEPDPVKLEIAKDLVRKAFEFAQIENTGSYRVFNQLAAVITEQSEMSISGKAIKELNSRGASEFNEVGFSGNKAKEVLAAFVMLKEGIIPDKSQLKFVNQHRKQKKIAHNIYFDKYCRIYSSTQENDERNRKAAYSGFSTIENRIPDYLTNTVWHIYTTDGEGAIYGHILKIGTNSNGCLTQCEIINAVKEYQDYDGCVGMDSTSSYLIFSFANKNTRQKYSQMMCKMAIGSKPSIILGIITFISSLKNKLVASITLLEKLDLDDNISTIIDSSETPVHIEVKRLLSLNRIRLLPFPEKTPSAFEELKKWLDEEEKVQKPDSPVDDVLVSYCQDYWIYYMSEDYLNQKQISKVEFKIYLSPDTNEVTGNLILSGEQKYEDGAVSRNGSFISAFFKKKLSAGVNTRTFYLVFKIGEVYIPDGMDCFIGIITGLSAQHESAISYRTLVVPKRFKDIDSEWLIEYFSSKEWRVETYDHKGFKFENL